MRGPRRPRPGDLPGGDELLPHNVARFVAAVDPRTEEEPVEVTPQGGLAALATVALTG
jgi:hypothetical protein